jgi:hypothetical protein
LQGLMVHAPVKRTSGPGWWSIACQFGPLPWSAARVTPNMPVRQYVGCSLRRVCSRMNLDKVHGDRDMIRIWCGHQMLRGGHCRHSAFKVI